MHGSEPSPRNLGLFGATGVGVGAIVGGGILALAGVAFAATGPGAIVAFGLNGVIALLTALSFAEMASKFPESGGTYAFSRKVLSIESAFAIGWVSWFASMVAAVLYALGFAYFAVVLATDLWQLGAGPAPAWLARQSTVTWVALAATLVLTAQLCLRSGGGGAWANVIKVIVFAVLLVGGAWALGRQEAQVSSAALDPFFTRGAGGLLQAMGYTFIALQGFDLVAAVGGEVRDPERNLPRAMVFSLLIALAIYLPLLLVVATVGVPAGTSIGAAAAADPERIVPAAAREFLGPTGYWLVIVAAVLSMFTALQANLFAASRIARAMARDRNLPARLDRQHAVRGTPVAAALVTGLIVCALVLALPDVAVAGAASSLIFLITFALAHGLSILVRRRSGERPPPFRAPLFPLVPIVGGLACVGLAGFQGLAVPAAGLTAIAWLGLGATLFLVLFARRARVRDATSTAIDPELVRLRGHTPLVLVPIANPRNAADMITLADALVPAHVGRVLLHSIVVAPADWDPDELPAPTERGLELLRELLRAATRVGIRAETLTTVAPNAMAEIARVARLHRCHSVVLGMSEFAEEARQSPLELLLSTLDAEVVVLRSRPGWSLPDARRILVPIAGRGGHESLVARLIGSLSRTGPREVTFVRVVPKASRPEALQRARRDLDHLTQDTVGPGGHSLVLPHDDPLGALAELALESDLVILGVQRMAHNHKLFGHFTRELAQRVACPVLVMSRRG